ncbi:alpha/beta hydrolase domain-containing protein [Pseudofrankia sp. BMG5.37]|uniref:alpha/beta hydrolase domain-containing protein n=1 Tax=Pseudofrankia sp. BMG5.37 TaxID=3050035 RepID=UPI0028959489|nr:alpha/beta hydrolase domain-containing protein [Pseudofrankia sp. BMG5.37]MDT3439113.1 alpha/beta hydrolase domain-containing protein [Pseudofrankia sp. BMG5.37]
MALVGLRDESVSAFADGREWGTAGAYEAVSAVAGFAVDPGAAANRGIVDLERVAGADGLARFEADLRVLRPRAGGNGWLVFVVPNRGLLGGIPFSAGAPIQLADLDTLDAGDGFLLARGWTVAWCGWQWDVARGEASVGLTAPTVDVGPGWLRIEFRPDTDQPDHPLSDSSPFFAFTDFPTVGVDDPDAFLTERLTPDGAPRPVPRDRWRFVDATTVALDGGFRAFHWYTLTYRTSLCPVVGTGLLAVRDAASWLRRTGGLTHAFAFGVSQSGRFLRQFLYEGRNVDEAGAVVFDGVFAHIAGARRGEFNHRYAQPSLTHPLGLTNLPPYDTAGLLAPPRAAAASSGAVSSGAANSGAANNEAGDHEAEVPSAVPKLFLTNSSWEYWRGDGALVHIHPETGEDLPDDPDARVYLLRGTDHFGALTLKEFMPGANPTHAHDVGPILRALFVALVEWVCMGDDPPPSKVPRWKDGTASTREAVLKQFATTIDAATTTAAVAIATDATDATDATGGAWLPDLDALNVTRDMDLGPGAETGTGRWPPVFGAAKPAVVAAVDADGNETAGVALPVVAVPVAAYTGWNPRRPVAGLPNPLYEFLGSMLPLLTDPGFPARDAYESAVRAAAAGLVESRFLIAEDVESTVREALTVYDRAAVPGRSPGGQPGATPAG